MSSSSNTDEANKKWTETVSSYLRYWEPMTLVAGRFLLNGLKLQFQSTSLQVIEAGAGTGGVAKELPTNLTGLSLESLYVTDIADGMLSKAEETLLSSETSKDTPNVIVEKGDFSNFHYPDSSFDRYYANMCLNYASDPNVVIQESYRILKPNGGIAGFTLWGHPKDSPCMTIVPDVLDELDLVTKKDHAKERTSFHLGQDDVALRQRFLQAGFTKVTLVHYPGVIETLSPADYVECIIDGAASTKARVDSFSKSVQVQIRDQVYQKAKAILDQGNPVMLDIIMIWAQK